MSYATEAELTTYAAARGVTISGTASILLTLAHDYIESLDYHGERYEEDQADKWPRTYVVVDGVELDYLTVPQGIKDAEMQAAIEIDGGNDPLANIERATKREKLDVLEVEYMDGTRESIKLSKVMALLRPYLKGSSSSGLLRGW